MSADTGSIGEVVYKARFPETTHAWASLGEIERDRYERAAELIFNRGFSGGVEYQKNADPPRRAKQYRDEAVEARAQLANLASAARAFIAAQSSDSVPVRHRAREQLQAELAQSEVTNPTTNTEINHEH